MRVLRPNSRNWKTDLAGQIPPGITVTVMHLGRGGVMADGTLDTYNKGRVLETLAVATDIQGIRPQNELRILWTGGCNREQDRSGAELPASEAGAAEQYAQTMQRGFTMLTEGDSTSTVENATRSKELVADSDVIVVVTDRLHYLARKVQFIMWLAFPQHKVVFVELHKMPPGTNWKKVATHLVSTLITTVGMIGVATGDAAGIQRRQNRLQSLTGH